MKRFVLLVVLFAVAALCASAAAEDGNVIEIRTVDDLKAVTDHPGARFRLMNDLDLRGEDWLPIPFSGELDGGNFGIYNLSVTRVGEEVRTTTDANWKEYENVFAGLFSTVEDSTIRDLKVIGAHVAIEGKTHTFAAILTGFAKYSNFDNVTVDGRVRLENEAVMAGVGGVAGFGSGRFTNCSARVELVFNDLNRESRCEEFLGAILADGYSLVQYCTAEIDGYVSCFGYCHNGGLMGMYYTSGTKFELGLENRIVNHNTVSGRIYFFEHNPDRRAYCKAAVGEIRTGLTKSKPNDTKGWSKLETREYKQVLEPETCENPVYEDEIIPPEDGAWGWTEHVCTTCGYRWRDQYTAP